MSVDQRVNEVLPVLEQQIKADYAPPHVKRDAHPKMHGCVLATVTVNPSIDPAFQHGVFSEPGKTYNAWVRLSNAFKIQHDLEFETRGLAVKLLNVDGPKLAADEADTQDFLFATWPAFFLPNGAGYREFALATEEGFGQIFRFFVGKRLFRALYQLLRSSIVLTRSPLAIPYFSQTPYRLGPHTVKLQVRPQMTDGMRNSLPAMWVFFCQAVAANIVLMTGQARDATPQAEAWCSLHIAPKDFLRLGMMEFLARHEAAFDLMIQRRTDPSTMPIDDATVVWPESRSPYERVATIRIPKQVFWLQNDLSEGEERAVKKMMELGENMSFQPWHALKDHEPLGAINEMRKRIYPAIVDFRRGLNDAPQARPAADYDAVAPLVLR